MLMALATMQNTAWATTNGFATNGNVQAKEMEAPTKNVLQAT